MNSEDRQLLYEQAAVIHYLSQLLSSTLDDGSTPEDFKVTGFRIASRYSRLQCSEELEEFLNQTLEARQKAIAETPGELRSRESEVGSHRNTKS